MRKTGFFVFFSSGSVNLCFSESSINDNSSSEPQSHQARRKTLPTNNSQSRDQAATTPTATGHAQNEAIPGAGIQSHASTEPHVSKSSAASQQPASVGLRAPVPHPVPRSSGESFSGDRSTTPVFSASGLLDSSSGTFKHRSSNPTPDTSSRRSSSRVSVVALKRANVLLVGSADLCRLVQRIFGDDNIFIRLHFANSQLFQHFSS